MKIACDNQALVSVLTSGKTRDHTLAAIDRIYIEYIGKNSKFHS